jgi:hypothetical protein
MGKEGDYPEAAVKKAVKAVLKGKGAYAYWPVKSSCLGATTVDCLACVPVRIDESMVGETIGAFVAIETKRTKLSEPTPAQENVMWQVVAADGVALLVHSVNQEEIARQIDIATGADD